MTKVFAHRGSKGTHPENTLAAFREAVRVGSDGIELDVHVTKDGELVVIHDETINRTTNGEGAIKELTVAELKAVSAGAWFADEYAAETIPTLKEVFDLLCELNFTGQLNIELKTDIIQYAHIVEKCVALQQSMELSFTIVYSSFNPYSIIEMKQLLPTQEVAFLYESVEMAKFDFEQTVIEGLHPDIRLLDWTLEQHPQLPLRVWTVNQSEDMQRCFGLNVEAIFTDYPAQALALRDGK